MPKVVLFGSQLKKLRRENSIMKCQLKNINKKLTTISYFIQNVNDLFGGLPEQSISYLMILKLIASQKCSLPPQKDDAQLFVKNLLQSFFESLKDSTENFNELGEQATQLIKLAIPKKQAGIDGIDSIDNISCEEQLEDSSSDNNELEKTLTTESETRNKETPKETEEPKKIITEEPNGRSSLESSLDLNETVIPNLRHRPVAVPNYHVSSPMCDRQINHNSNGAEFNLSPFIRLEIDRSSYSNGFSPNLHSTFQTDRTPLKTEQHPRFAKLSNISDISSHYLSTTQGSFNDDQTTIIKPNDKTTSKQSKSKNRKKNRNTESEMNLTITRNSLRSFSQSKNNNTVSSKK